MNERFGRGLNRFTTSSNFNSPNHDPILHGENVDRGDGDGSPSDWAQPQRAMNDLLHNQELQMLDYFGR